MTLPQRTRLATLAAICTATGFCAAAPAVASALPPRPVLAGQRGYLLGVAVVSAGDVWAVGARAASPGAIVDHLHGRVWHRLSGPVTHAAAGQLASVTALSRHNLWTVGSAGAGTLAAHWNGRRLVRVPTPSPGSDASLESVTALSRTNVWAVGSHLDPGQEYSRTLIEHWTGSGWRLVPSPSPTAYATLSAVSAVSPHDVWAVGSDEVSTLVLRWNGHHWRRVPAPGTGELLGVAAISAKDVWAVGTTGAQAQILHWNGRRWQKVSAPRPGRYSLLSGATAASAGDVWAAGWVDVQRGGAERTKTLVMRWSGARWKVVPTPNVPERDDALTAVSARTGRDAWAVGYSGDGATSRVLALHWNGRRWRRA